MTNRRRARSYFPGYLSPVSCSLLSDLIPILNRFLAACLWQLLFSLSISLLCIRTFAEQVWFPSLYTASPTRLFLPEAISRFGLYVLSGLICFHVTAFACYPSGEWPIPVRLTCEDLVRRAVGNHYGNRATPTQISASFFRDVILNANWWLVSADMHFS